MRSRKGSRDTLKHLESLAASKPSAASARNCDPRSSSIFFIVIRFAILPAVVHIAFFL